jgi:hypothetical protein
VNYNDQFDKLDNILSNSNVNGKIALVANRPTHKDFVNLYSTAACQCTICSVIVNDVSLILHPNPKTKTIQYYYKFKCRCILQKTKTSFLWHLARFPNDYIHVTNATARENSGNSDNRIHSPAGCFLIDHSKSLQFLLDDQFKQEAMRIAAATNEIASSKPSQQTIF